MTAAGDRLRANTERILLLWVQRVREEIAAAHHEAHPIIIDTLPAVLLQLAEALSRDHPRRTATHGSTVAHEHGGERVRLTEVVRQTLDRIHLDDGRGVGLAQVRAVAEAHGGSIGIDSLPERGTTFIIDIPVDARPYQGTPTHGAGLESDGR